MSNSTLKRHRWSQYLVLSFSILSISLAFQNCGQPGAIGVNSIASDSNSGTSTPSTPSQNPPQYAVSDLSKSTPPPLKLIFVMDNSNSMTLNNLNLKNSISAMFDQQADNISAFDTDIYFIGTAQSPSLANSFLPQLQSPESLINSSLNQIYTLYRGPTWISGKLAGDALGFKLVKTQGSDFLSQVYAPAPVVDFQADSSNSQLKVLTSVSFKKGSSIDDLKNSIAARLDVLAPSKASQIQEASIFKALDTESGLCATARILKHPAGIIQPGDLASFIIVSDEDESDPRGTLCLDESRRDYLYQVSCQMSIPASTKYYTKFQYQTLPGSDYYQTTLNISPPDTTAYKKISSFTLSRPSQPATCQGTFEKDFYVKYNFEVPNFQINYTKWVKVGDREGGVVVYSQTPTQGNLKLSGTLPSDCESNVKRVQDLLSDSTSKINIDGCSVLANTKLSDSVTLSYAAYPQAAVPSNQCSTDLLAKVSNLISANPNYSGGTVSSCATTNKVDSIPSSWIMTSSFMPMANEGLCLEAINYLCLSQNQIYKNCQKTGYTESSEAYTKGPISITDTANYSCSSTCDKVPGLCDIDSPAKTISTYANSIKSTCSVVVTNSTQTFTTTKNPQDIVINSSKAVTCQDFCSAAPSACSGNASSTVTIAAFNKNCSVKSSQLVAGSTPITKDLGQVEDSTQSLSCNSLCSAATGLCSKINASQQSQYSVSQYISQFASGQNCTTSNITQSIPDSVVNKVISKLKSSDANATACPVGYSYISKSVTSDYVDSAPLVSGQNNLSDYIQNQLDQVVGTFGSSLSAFITMPGEASSKLATSEGLNYKALVDSLGRGVINNIRSSSYAPALLNLSNILKSQVQRSISFKQLSSQQKVHQVWKRQKTDPSWGDPLSTQLWSASGGTITLDPSVSLDENDEIQIEYY